MARMQKIVSNLWFDKNAQEAVEFYSSVFKNSSIGRITHYGKEGHEQHGMPAGSIMTIEFRLENNDFLALNGGPHFKFSEAVSFVIYCDDQHEIDYYWQKLSEGGDKNAQQCGWLKDKFGLSWQVVPTALPDMMHDTDPEKAAHVMKAMLKMKKLDLAALKKAFTGQ
jgi:predicted 3-demethylubiquinone-9 3-methyltransferase (glyoxalase superfamily)